jgi:hypothetical protein
VGVLSNKKEVAIKMKEKGMTDVIAEITGLPLVMIGKIKTGRG